LNTTIPILLSNVSSLNLDVAWSYSVGNKPSNSTDSDAIEAAGMNANVCVDMFLASDKDKSISTTESQYEVMVWVGRYGPATQPIGIVQGSKDAFIINGTRFDLYSGTNGINQQVHTWVADKNATRFNGNIAPLITRLSANGGPKATDHLGYVAFGSEALYSPQNMTFYVPKLQLEVEPVS